MNKSMQRVDHGGLVLSSNNENSINGSYESQITQRYRQWIALLT